MAFVMLAGVLLLFLLSYLFTDKDFLSPVNLYLLYAVCAVAGMFLCYKEWNVSEYGAAAAGIFLLGSFCFALGCFGAKLISNHSVKRCKEREIPGKTVDNDSQSKRIDIGLLKIAVMICAGVVAVYGTWAYLIRLEGDTTDYTITLAINNRRTMDINGKLVGDLAKGRVWTLFTEISGVFACLALLVFVRNAVNRVLKKKDVLLFVPVVLCCLELLLLSNRSGIFSILITGVAAWFISEKLKNGWDRTLNKKVIKTGLITITAFLVFFFGSLFIVGRQISLKYFGIKQYSAIYLSGGVRCLDLYIEDPVAPSNLFGEETLVALHANLYSRFGIGKSNTRYLEWRKLNNEPVANTYTAYRRFYHDFGITGVVLLSLFQGLIISALYYMIAQKSKGGRISFCEVMYCYLAHSILYIAVDDLFFSSWASLYGIKMVAIIFAAYFVLFRIVRKEDGGIRIDWKGNGIVHAKD